MSRETVTSDSDDRKSAHRIAVVAHALWSAGGLTVGRNLIEAIVQIAPENEYCFVVPDGVGYEEVCAQAPRADVHAIPPMGAMTRIRFDRSRLPEIVGAFAPDVVLALDSSHSIPDSPWPQAVLVHDAHLVYPKSYFGSLTLRGTIRHAYLRRHFQRTLANTKTVFVQTSVMESRLREAFDFDRVVTVLGPSTTESLHDRTTSPNPPPGILPYERLFKLLCITRYAPHKNLERIVDVFDEYRVDLAGTVVFITISAEQHRGAARLLRRIDKLGLGRQIVNLGEIPHVAIGSYYEHCDALLMPTTLESFGYPYVEAMALNLPILTSDLDFARGTCGEAAFYFDPWDVAEIKDAILQISSDSELRRRLVLAGNDRGSRDRSWTQIAKVILADLDDISLRTPGADGPSD